MAIKTYEELMNLLTEAGNKKILTDDKMICDLFSYVNSYPADETIQDIIITTNGKATVGDIISMVVLKNESLLCRELEIPYSKSTIPYIEITKTYHNRLGSFLKLIDEYPDFFKQETSINVSKFINDILTKQKELIYYQMIGLSNPEKSNDVNAYTYKAKNVYVKIKKHQIRRSSKSITYWVSLFLPNGDEEVFLLSIDMIGSRFELLSKISKMDNNFTSVLKNKNII